FLGEGLCGDDFLFERPRAQDGADDVRAFVQELSQIEVRFVAGYSSSEEYASFHRERLDVSSNVGAADKIEDDIEAVAFGLDVGEVGEEVE
ncbi:MAG: hypothetical protein JWN45_3118, partial [Acidobacteriaceae bacterium]|nr:hypothetical protein [Acidobacteriaceae bacterium]